MRQAKVLRLVRQSAKAWWYFRQLRTQGQHAKAAQLERDSIRNTIKLMRTAKIDQFSAAKGWIDFARPTVSNPLGDTVSVSNVPVAEMAAWIYVYGQRLGAQQ